MKSRAVAFAVLYLPLVAAADGRAASLKRLVELGKQSESITKHASEREVASILGEPQSKGNGGWSHPERKVWHYLDYTDDSLHRSFSVWFDSTTGCSVSKIEILREEVEKSPLLVSTGTVLQVYPNYPKEGDKGFLCDVRFNRDGRDFTLGVAVEALDRVKGTPRIGATVRVEHRGDEPNFIFLGAWSLYLESMVFTNKVEQVAPSDGNKPSN